MGTALIKSITTIIFVIIAYILLQSIYVDHKLKIMHFKFDQLPQTSPQKSIIFVSDPKACYWCLKQTELWNEQTQKFLDNKGYTLVRLNVQDGIQLARKMKLNHFSGFPATLFFNEKGVESNRIYGVFNMKKLIKAVNQIK